MKKLTITGIIILISLMLLTACEQLNIKLPDITRGSGKVVTEKREVESFNKVIINGAGEVTIKQGDKVSLKIDAEDNIITYITSEVKNNTLIIGYESNLWQDKILPTKVIKYTISVVDLKSLTINGAVDLSNECLSGDNFEVNINGAGKFEFEALTLDDLIVEIAGGASVKVVGEAVSQRVTISGAGTYNGEDFKTQTTEFDFNGAGEAKIWATETLEMSIGGAGSIKYWGSPQVTQKITGIGSITSMGEK